VSYEIVFKRKARKGVVRLPENLYERVTLAIDDLAAEPRPRGAVKMRGTGQQEEWRVRVGDYRIVYRVNDESQQVVILAVGHRGSVYG
jgi:mRNA interferase RelE/StbE